MTTLESPSSHHYAPRSLPPPLSRTSSPPAPLSLQGAGLLQISDLLALAIALCKLPYLANPSLQQESTNLSSTVRTSAFGVLRQFLLLDTHGMGRLSLTSFRQGILAQQKLLQCFTIQISCTPSSPSSSQMDSNRASCTSRRASARLSSSGVQLNHKEQSRREAATCSQSATLCNHATSSLMSNLTF